MKKIKPSPIALSGQGRADILFILSGGKTLGRSREKSNVSYFIMTLSRTVFLRLLAHAPEAVQREAKEDARRAIAALCFTEDDIRRMLAQEELWDELTDDEQEEAILRLMDAGEYEQASNVGDQSIAEAVARYLHETSLKKNEQMAGSELTW